MFCGIDWAEDHHDVALVDHDGNLWPSAGSATTRPGSPQLLQLLAEAGDSAGDPIPVAIETSRGLLVACLRATGRTVYRDQPDGRRPLPRPALGRAARSPTPATRWCWPTSCAPTWPRTAPLPADSELAQAIAVLARAQQDAVWARTSAHNKLRSLLREYYPALLAAFASQARRHPAPGSPRPAGRRPHPPRGGPADPAAAAGTAAPGRPPARHRRRGRSGSSRCCARDYLHHPPLVEDAFGAQALRPAAPARHRLRQRRRARRRGRRALSPSTRTRRSSPACPGSPTLTGARVLAEIGDDRARFADARGLKAYAGSAPVTRASGKTTAVLHRRVKNQRLAAVGYIWAFAALTASPGARAHYDRRTSRRRPARRRPTQPVQPPPRLPAPLPAHPPDLQRSHRLPHHISRRRGRAA